MFCFSNHSLICNMKKTTVVLSIAAILGGFCFGAILLWIDSFINFGSLLSYLKQVSQYSHNKQHDVTQSISDNKNKYETKHDLVQESCNNLTFNVLIATSLLGGNHGPVLHRVEKTIFNNHLNYAKLHNYSYFCLEHKITTDDITAQWQKPYLLEQLFYNRSNFINDSFYSNSNHIHINQRGRDCDFDHILWIDFDAIFMNDEVTVESILDYAVQQLNTLNNVNNISRTDVELVVTGDQHVTVNGGVVVWKKSNFTKKIMTTWRRSRALHRSVDSLTLGVVLQGLKEYDDDGKWQNMLKQRFSTATESQAMSAMKNLMSEEYKKNVVIAKQRLMNSYDLRSESSGFHKGDFIVHFAGRENKDDLVFKYLKQKQSFQ